MHVLKIKTLPEKYIKLFLTFTFEGHKENEGWEGSGESFRQTDRH